MTNKRVFFILHDCEDVFFTYMPVYNTSKHGARAEFKAERLGQVFCKESLYMLHKLCEEMKLLLEWGLE